MNPQPIGFPFHLRKEKYESEMKGIFEEGLMNDMLSDNHLTEANIVFLEDLLKTIRLVPKKYSFVITKREENSMVYLITISSEDINFKTKYYYLNPQMALDFNAFNISLIRILKELPL